MGLISCPECKSKISSKTINCPKCGHPIKESPTDSFFSELACDGACSFDYTNSINIYFGYYLWCVRYTISRYKEIYYHNCRSCPAFYKL